MPDWLDCSGAAQLAAEDSATLTSVVRCKSRAFLVSGDAQGKVSVLPFPCNEKFTAMKGKTYNGHCGCHKHVHDER